MDNDLKKKAKLSWSKIANIKVNHKFPEEMHIFKQTVLPYIYATLFRFSSSLSYCCKFFLGNSYIATN